MAIKNIIAKGIGFTPDSTKWIVTHGFSIEQPVTTFSMKGAHFHPGKRTGGAITELKTRDPIANYHKKIGRFHNKKIGES